MQVSIPNNDVKIYNLSCGKSLPDWLTEKKRRKLLKKNVDLRRRIELIQNFDMPAVSTNIKVSNDGQYILATGIYKPRVKCFEMCNLSLKFERCFDSDVEAFHILSDDYSKLIFLHCDRNIEFHSAPGKYHKLRIPRFGRDITYHYPSCDIFVVGDSSDIYRINLERGQFLKPFESESWSINKCCVNPVHHLLVVGNHEGKVEAWDPRTKNKVGTLDCALDCMNINHQDELFHNGNGMSPAVTALNFQGALNMAVGTSTGQILLYDIRANKPTIIKDHMYGLPIKNVYFHDTMDLVYSMDSSIVKIWEKNTGKLYTSIEANAHADFNDLTIFPNTGMLLMAVEAPKMQIYYIPSLGPAPKWAGFLDNLTEELEELNYENIYDDYKFVTSKELDDLGLSHLTGTNLLRAYMHGYFMDVRLWSKAKQLVEPFSYNEYKKKKIREKINEDRASRLKLIKQQQVDNLPRVNKELAMKYQGLGEEGQKNIKKKKLAEKQNVLKDDRFKELFTNPDFQIDVNSEEFSRHAMAKLATNRKLEKLKKKGASVQEDEGPDSDLDVDPADRPDSDDELFNADDDGVDDSSDDEKKVKMSKKEIEVAEGYRKKMKQEQMERSRNLNNEAQERKLTMIARDDYDVHNRDKKEYMRKRETVSLGERLKNDFKSGSGSYAMTGSRGNKVITFKVNRKRKFRRK